MGRWCQNSGGGRQHTEGVSVAEEGAIKTLVHLHLAGWHKLLAVFQDAEKHWKQLEEQQVATCQMVRNLLLEQQPSVCVVVGAPFSPPLQPPVPTPRRTGGLLPPSCSRVLGDHLSHPSLLPEKSQQPPCCPVSVTLAVSAASTAFPDMLASRTGDWPAMESL
ncbi:hypothetical protein AOLI_G00158070 [Acnodon oligacanthus]